MLRVFALAFFFSIASCQYYDYEDGTTVAVNLSDAAVTIMNFVGEDLIDNANATNGTATFKAYTTTQATVFIACTIGSFLVLSGLAVVTNARDIYSQRKIGLRKAHA